VLVDDEEVVPCSSSGGADVEPAVGGGARDELVGDVDGVALVAMLGCPVSQPDVLAGVVPGESHVAVFPEMGRDDRAVGEGGGDRPQITVADRLTCGCEKVAVVAAGHDHITHGDALPCSDRRSPVLVEVAGAEASGLDGGVDRVDVSVARRRDGDRLTGGDDGHPLDGEVVEVLIEAACGDPTVRFVHFQDAWVASAEPERCGGFPGVREAVEARQLVDLACSAELGEHPTPTDRLQLPVVTDQHQPPSFALGQVDQLGEAAGAEHARLVNDHRCP
jgi:hypothetical protein